MKAKILPGRCSDAVHIPASKSLSHRALIASALADGRSLLKNLADNNDTRATLACLEALGVSAEKKAEGLCVSGIRNLNAYDGRVIDCGESGSTLRFLIPLFSLAGKEVTFTGHGRLMERPQNVYREIFEQQGLAFEQQGQFLKIHGSLKPGRYEVKGDVSSQFISGLLFALPLLDGDSLIHIIPPYESASYVGLTKDVLSKSGISIVQDGMDLKVPGNQKYHPLDMRIDGDDSQAVFPASLAYCLNRSIAVSGISHSSLQGDHAFLDILKKAGALIEESEDGYLFQPGELQAQEVDLEDCPDLGPMLFALAVHAQGTTIFHHCERLRIKESDRIACMEEELGKLGCQIWSSEGDVFVKGPSLIKGGAELDGHNDHRIVMALSVLSAGAEEPVMIDGAEAVRKSWPSFFEDMGLEVEWL